jgi:ribosomal protein S18 acetylase RimI-like enzyme
MDKPGRNGIEGAQMQYTIRLAAPQDQGMIEEIVRQAYEPWVTTIGARPGPMDADYADLIAANRVHVVARAGDVGSDDVAGLIVLIPEADVLVLDNVAVRPRLHGQGFGRALLNFAEEEARRLGLPAVRLFTHEKMTANIDLYNAIGYVETGRQEIDGGQLVHMRKHL